LGFTELMKSELISYPLGCFVGYTSTDFASQLD